MKFLLVLLGALLPLAAGCAAGAAPSAPGRIRMVLDSDANNELDDQHAIAYALLNADRFDVEAITVNRTRSGGDVEAQAAEAERVVRLLGVQDRVPVLRGADGSFEEIAPHLGRPDHDGAPAVDFIVRAARESSGSPLVLLAVGKLTNVALALKKDPAIAPRVRVVWLGSNYPEPGEYNQVNDEGALRFLLDQEVPLEIVVVRYGKPSGTDAVRVTLAEARERMAGRGPRVKVPVPGRNGGEFVTFGDYAVDLFENIDMHGDPPSRALFDMAAVAIVKDPAWATASRIPAPALVDGKWVARPGNPRTVTIWEDFDRDAIVEDLYRSLERPALP